MACYRDSFTFYRQQDTRFEDKVATLHVNVLRSSLSSFTSGTQVRVSKLVFILPTSCPADGLIPVKEKENEKKD
jgi:hypothetical protein